ncbi:spore germination protein [Anaerobacillus sp. CMMVII]|uniref:spore germination protein n=1 Tax=Anaerobacillus sp. CMMVII TaxID=2755588 RepID=UPI0021B74E38|nr:spore germination protein [Anaerobacillus sp. CMMVII]MCT8139421.1 spore germination protein [Anaerobacillus sp. CMMVII]
MDIKERLAQEVFLRLKKNVEEVEVILGNSSDLVKREFSTMEPMNLDCCLLYIEGLIDTSIIDQTILSPLLNNNQKYDVLDKLSTEEKVNTLEKKLLLISSLSTATKLEEVIDKLLAGNTILFLDHSEKAFVLPTQGWETRGIEEPQTETVIRGPRDGFVESIRTNIALVRRRIRDPMFRLISMQIGKRSKTDIGILYIEGLVREGLVDEVLQRLNKIEIDAILESNYVEELISDTPSSPFLTAQGTERPDKIAAGLYEGKVAILVDNTPFALLVPTHFWSFLSASDDYYTHFWMAAFFRFIRYTAFIISLTLPSLFVLLVSFHQEMIPTPLAITIAAGREIVPLPVLLEAIIMELAFELMREAGLRMPKPIGQAVSIVGSLIIGQAAVEAGLVSPIMVIVVATTGIASFAIPNYFASVSVRLVRFPILLASGLLGLLGFATVFVVVLIHALSLRSFGEPYLAPIFPFNASDQKDTLFRSPLWTMGKRPKDVKENNERQDKNQKPSPNGDG